MPRKPASVCQCGALKIDGRCRTCGTARETADKRRGTSQERGYDSRWRRYSERYRLLNPWCIECKEDGKLTPSAVVDHVEPHRGDMQLFWDPSNHQPLCKRHHDRKTASGR